MDFGASLRRPLRSQGKYLHILLLFSIEILQLSESMGPGDALPSAGARLMGDMVEVDGGVWVGEANERASLAC